MTALVVLLPGLDGTGTLLADVATALRPSVDAEIISYPPDRALGYEALGAWVRARLPTDRPFILLGESFAGPIAVSIAASEPRGLIGLVLACSFVRPPRPPLVSLAAMVAAIPIRVPDMLANTLLLGRFASARLTRQFSQALEQLSPAVLRARLLALASVDASRELARIRVPTLYLRGSKDRLIPASVAADVQRIRPGIDVTALEGPHALLQANPIASASRIRDFAVTCAERMDRPKDR